MHGACLCLCMLTPTKVELKGDGTGEPSQYFFIRDDFRVYSSKSCMEEVHVAASIFFVIII